MDEKVPELAQELALIRAAQSGDRKARDQLFESSKGLVWGEVRRRAKKSSVSEADQQDLFQEGLLGLNRAIDRFDLSTGNALSTFAVPWIRGRITDAAERIDAPQDSDEEGDGTALGDSIQGGAGDGPESAAEILEEERHRRSRHSVLTPVPPVKGWNDDLGLQQSRHPHSAMTGDVSAGIEKLANSYTKMSPGLDLADARLEAQKVLLGEGNPFNPSHARVEALKALAGLEDAYHALNSMTSMEDDQLTAGTSAPPFENAISVADAQDIKGLVFLLRQGLLGSARRQISGVAKSIDGDIRRHPLASEVIAFAIEDVRACFGGDASAWFRDYRVQAPEPAMVIVRLACSNTADELVPQRSRLGFSFPAHGGLGEIVSASTMAVMQWLNSNRAKDGAKLPVRVVHEVLVALGVPEEQARTIVKNAVRPKKRKAGQI